MTSRLAVASGASAAIIVGASVPVTGMLQDYPLLTGQAMRYALSGLVLLAWTYARGRRPVPPKLGDLPALLALVAFGMLGFNAAVLHALLYADPGFVAAMLGGTPVVLALAGRKRSAVTVAGAGIVAMGVVLLSCCPAVARGAWHGPGLLLAALALAGEAAFTLFAIGVVRRLGGVAVATWSCLIAGAVGAAVGTFVGGWQTPTLKEGIALVTLAVALTAVAFGLWYFAVGRLGADRAGVLIGLTPISGLIVSVALGAQDFTLLGLVGAAVVAVGCVVGLSSSRARPRAGTVEPVPAP